MRIVDCLWCDPYNDPWSESELDEKFVVASINSFHKALDCRSSRLENSGRLNRNGNFLECSRRNVAKKSSLRDCYGNQNGQKRTKLARNEINQLSSRPSKQLNSRSQRKQIKFSQFQPNKQSCLKTAKTVRKNSTNQNKKKHTHGRRCQKNSIGLTTGGRIHHKNGETTKVRRTSSTRSGIDHYLAQTNCQRKRRSQKLCSDKEK